ncbi:MAG: Na/Pi symporter [Candidatus Methylomirabilales bacterium]
MHVRRLPRRSSQHPAFTLATLLALLYLFFVSIALMSSSITFFGKDFAEKLLTTTANPFVGLLIGIVATSLIQSSSTTTSMVVSLVAADALSLQGAIPIVMGANVGTSVTNTLVAVAQIGRAQEFRRSFAAATVHDFFNLIAIVILFPIQVTTDFLGITAGFLENVFGQLGGLTLANPLKTATKPVVGALEATTGQSGPLLLMLAFVLLFLSLRYIVILLKTLVIGKVEAFFTEKLFRNAGTALIFGFVLTLMVQSSSITTSLAVPLAGAGILTIRQIFAMTLGANAGTTFTAILASLITGSQIAVTVAFSHLVFNVVGILLIWPIQRVPIFLAESLATWAVKYKALPLLYIGIVFFLLPLIGIYLGG